MQRTTPTWSVLALVFAALGPRLWGIGFLLPHSHEPDALVFLIQYRASESSELEDFLASRPIPYRAPMLHRVACITSAVATASLPLFALLALMRWRRRIRSGRSGVIASV